MPVQDTDGTIYHQAAPGCGMIFYEVFAPDRIVVGCAKRTSKVGEGYGISAGGFANCNTLMQKPVGTVVNAMIEATYREMKEELKGVHRVIPRKSFLQKARHLTTFLVRTADANGLHSCTYYAYPVVHEQRSKLIKLSSDETEGLAFYHMTWNKKGRVSIALPKNGRKKGHFYHAHELLAFQALADLHRAGRLAN